MIPALKGACAAALSGLVSYIGDDPGGRRAKARSPLAAFCRASGAGCVVNPSISLPASLPKLAHLQKIAEHARLEPPLSDGSFSQKHFPLPIAKCRLAPAWIFRLNPLERAR